MAETWLTAANVRDPGPVTHLDQYATPPGNNPYGNEMRFVVNHSAEGYFSSQSPSSVMRARGNSWHLTVYQSGHVVQSYPLEAICWHAGPKGNIPGIGIEHEGKAGEVLTVAQLEATIRVQSEICRRRGWPNIQKGVTGFEHNQFMATACPSGRIPWAAIEAGTRVPAPPAPLPPLSPTGIWPDVQQVSLNVTLYADTNLVRLPEGTIVKALAKGTVLQVKGLWKGSHYLTAYSFDNKIPNGFPVSATVAPPPPPPAPPPPPPPPTDPCAAEKARIAEMGGTIAALQQQVVALEQQVTALTDERASLRTRIALLESEQGVLAADAAIGRLVREIVGKVRVA